MPFFKKRLFATLMSLLCAAGAGVALARASAGDDVGAHMRTAIEQFGAVTAVLLFDATTMADVAMAHLAVAAAALHPWIAVPLTWLAAPSLAAAAMSRVMHGEQGERLAFGALAVACFGFALENLLIAHAVDHVALTALASTRLQLSAMSNVLLCAFPLLICFKLIPTRKSLEFLKDSWNFVIPLLGTAGVVVIALGPSTSLTNELTNALANDEVLSTAAWIASGAALTSWARRYGIGVMMLAAASSCAIAVPQFRYYEGNILLLDLMRAGGTTLALIIAMAPLPGLRQGQGLNQIDDALRAADPEASKS